MENRIYTLSMAGNSPRNTDSSILNATAALKLLLRIPECVELTGIGRSTLYVLMASGELPSVKIGRSRRVRVQDLLNWIESKKTI